MIDHEKQRLLSQVGLSDWLCGFDRLFLMEVEMNTWPGGKRHAMYQSEHERWNATHYPGTRQMCVVCDEPTERCEEDSIYTEEGQGPLCEHCYNGPRLPEYLSRTE